MKHLLLPRVAYAIGLAGVMLYVAAPGYDSSVPHFSIAVTAFTLIYISLLLKLKLRRLPFVLQLVGLCTISLFSIATAFQDSSTQGAAVGFATLLIVQVYGLTTEARVPS